MAKAYAARSRLTVASEQKERLDCDRLTLFGELAVSKQRFVTAKRSEHFVSFAASQIGACQIEQTAFFGEAVAGQAIAARFAARPRARRRCDLERRRVTGLGRNRRHATRDLGC